MIIGMRYMNISAIRTMRSVETIISVGCGGFAYWYFSVNPDPDALYRVAGAFAGVAGTLLGFMIAGLSILTAVIDRRTVVNLRKTGHYDNLLHEVYWVSSWFLVAMTASLMSLFLADRWLTGGVAVATGSMVFATLLFVSAGRKFALVMRLLQ